MADAVVSRAPATVWATPERVAYGIAVLSGLIALWNAVTYPSAAGYDAASHREYADFLIQHHRLPYRDETPEYYSPPLYYLIAGTADWIGRHAGLGDPHKLGQLLNVPLVVGAVLLMVALARLLWPSRPWLPVLAAGFVALSPVLTRTAAMFNPEPADLFASVLCAYLAARILAGRRYGAASALGLGAVLGAAQMVRQFELYTLAVVGLAYLSALWWRPAERRALLRSLAVVLAAVALLAAPWYAYRAVHYANPIFDRPHSTKPFFERRPASFYLGSGLPGVFTHPYRPNLANEVWPQTYADVWGDWYGVFAWPAETAAKPSRAANAWLVLQDVVGVVPTLLAVGGWVALLVLSFRRRDSVLLLPALMPLAGLAGYLYFAIGYPTVDGDVIKPTFMLSTLWAWALCFAWAAGWAARRAPRLVVPALVAFAVIVLPFVLYRGAVGFF